MTGRRPTLAHDLAPRLAAPREPEVEAVANYRGVDERTDGVSVDPRADGDVSSAAPGAVRGGSLTGLAQSVSASDRCSGRGRGSGRSKGKGRGRGRCRRFVPWVESSRAGGRPMDEEEGKDRGLRTDRI
ncbi:hypothetical protein Mp_4g16140 [Marchantia polymorpha subsp. ruderalis]|uniref:Uncharacterized protein n=2 Tax=Marchantia polymorpha TaxID=3197 RepID=A0AAF6BAE9_MARPO|nr:hypothetical protein MARPO_0054s0079 [Marchantia polymorpha]PTQ37971.1 hypothetical protein MARPO_0054s0079 [Marchantia polymorpha]BBN08983.1 hypothetical protein Mp_4g16140 [Marchantia polymorpha subsp. ruderalis]BBN08984.1 hypothetical protein Mp_4g16140 [Marchantia polymorpha subsp. ruderalis]|eukprot:PTQ37970.1 hypothetical protein MARPO_0054s0079 [Marchantia polymorpha]